VRDDKRYLRLLGTSFLAPRPAATIAAFASGIKPGMGGISGFSRGLTTALALGLMVQLGGCASTPSWVKPWKWLDSEKAAKATATPDPGLQYPNLADVPPKPKGMTPDEIRLQMTAGLVSDRANARHSDEVLRNASMSDGSPPISTPTPAMPAPPVAMAPAPVSPAAPIVAAPAPAAPARMQAQVENGMIEFAPGSAKVDPAQRTKLSTIAALQKESRGKVRVIGRAAEDEPIKAKDATTRIINLFDLSLRRAQAVAAELQKLGVPSDVLLVEGKGADAMAARTVAVTLE